MKIGFIIVSYHSKQERLSEILVFLSGSPTIIVDNSGSLNLTKNSRVRILKNFLNLGFGRAANRGIEEFLEEKFEWVVVLNQDIHLTVSAVKAFLSVLKKKAPSIVGPFAGSFDKKRWTTVLPSKKVDYISGSCMAIHSDIFKKIGYFYEPYFMYYEDADFCVRAKKAGFPIIPLSIAGISHEDATSLGRGSFLHSYYLARNHLLFVERNAPISVKIHELFRLPKTIWEHWKKGETGALVGIRDYFLRRFGKYTPL